jgi:hypothetical protein
MHPLYYSIYLFCPLLRHLLKVLTEIASMILVFIHQVSIHDLIHELCAFLKGLSRLFSTIIIYRVDSNAMNCAHSHLITSRVFL